MMYLSEMCLVFSAAIKMMSQVMDQVIVHEDNIKRNLNMTHGLIVSERVMLDLAVTLVDKTLTKSFTKMHKKRLMIRSIFSMFF